MKVLTLAGWAQPADALSSHIPGSEHFAYGEYNSSQEAIMALQHYTPDIAIGWSLGGQLLVRGIAAGLLKPRLLVLLGTSYQFVATTDYLQGMGRQTYSQFRDNYAEDPVRTSGRFNALIVKGDNEYKRLLPLLSGNSEAAKGRKWLRWLDELADFSCKTLDFTNFPSTLLIHGKQDAIVNVAQADSFAAKLPDCRIDLWEGCGHAPHLHSPDRILSLIRNSLEA